MDLPLVSIVILTYNQVGFINQTLQGSIDQDYENLEIIVSDDASTDGTDKIIAEYGNKYPGRLKPLLGERNIGITGNSNRALSACNGKYIAFQGGDDIMLPGKIRHQVDWLEADPQRILCGHDVEIFDSNTDKPLALWSKAHRSASLGTGEWIMKYGVPFAATAGMVRRDAIPTYGFDERVPIASDWKLYLDVMSKGGVWGCIDGVFARYRVSEKNISKSHLLLIRDRLVTVALAESEYPFWVEYSRYPRASIFFDAGVYYLKQKQYQFARGLFRVSLANAFFSWKQLAALFFSIMPEGWGLNLLKDKPVPRTLVDFIKDFRANK